MLAVWGCEAAGSEPAVQIETVGDLPVTSGSPGSAAAIGIEIVSDALEPGSGRRKHAVPE